MKKLPIIALLLAPYAIVTVTYLTDSELTPGLLLYGFLILFNMVYAFLLPKTGFGGRQLLLWNLLLKLLHIPLLLFMGLFILIITLAGGNEGRDYFPVMLCVAGFLCYALQLTSAMFGLSGFLQYRKQGLMSAAGVFLRTIGQLIPCVDVLCSIFCYFRFRKKEPSAG